MGVKDSEFATNDLYNNIEKGNFPSWTWFVQAMPEKDAATYKFDVFDVTKVWPHSDYPLIPVGKLVLNRNPTNYHTETEQSAFAPSHLVPGIEPSNDRMLQGRLLNYPDTHRHRLGPNYDQIPINCPYRATLGNYNTRDGPMVVNGGKHGNPNYEPNSLNGPVEDKSYAIHGQHLNAKVGRYPHQHPNTNYE
jgi:catalase